MCVCVQTIIFEKKMTMQIFGMVIYLDPAQLKFSGQGCRSKLVIGLAMRKSESEVGKTSYGNMAKKQN